MKTFIILVEQTIDNEIIGSRELHLVKANKMNDALNVIIKDYQENDPNFVGYKLNSDWSNDNIKKYEKDDKELIFMIAGSQAIEDIEWSEEKYICLEQ